MNNEGKDSESVVARSAKDGGKLWATRLGRVGNPDQQPNYPAARSTPTVDGSFVYALSSDGDIACVEAAGGKLRWKKSLRTDFGGVPGIWAYSESPLVDGDKVVVTPGGPGATIVALNKKTGEVIWKSAIPGGDRAGYASAIVAEAGGVRQYVQFLGNGLVGVDAATGKFLWRYDKTADVRMGSQISTPVVSGGLIYSSTNLVGHESPKLPPNQHHLPDDESFHSSVRSMLVLQIPIMYSSVIARTPVSQAHERLAEAVEMLRSEAVVLERFGRPAAILLNPDRYDELLEAIDDVQSAADFEPTMSSEGGNIPWERVKADLGWT